ncbi:unnamed protein product [Paramecium sonneborni]|uniref:Ubiquitin-like domain-containing protein n=1 Tax=Paramecium sonneborni TaxID=65129 RepID=A0A8S1JTV1_9CILI|nr:unnamed protein product [Paramecium sonneborni]
MNQLMGLPIGGQQQQNAQPNTIAVNVTVIMPTGDVQLQIQIDPDIPFNGFVKGLSEQIFAQRMQAQYEDTIEYLLGGANIQSNEMRTLSQLGFENQCRLQVRLKLKGG